MNLKDNMSVVDKSKGLACLVFVNDECKEQLDYIFDNFITDFYDSCSVYIKESRLSVRKKFLVSNGSPFKGVYGLLNFLREENNGSILVNQNIIIDLRGSNFASSISMIEILYDLMKALEVVGANVVFLVDKQQYNYLNVGGLTYLVDSAISTRKDDYGDVKIDVIKDRNINFDLEILKNNMVRNGEK